jgi:putative transposase
LPGSSHPMPLPRRLTLGNYVYHVLNRGARKGPLFVDSDDYRQFETLLLRAKERTRMRIVAYCLMPNHWHLLLWPYGNGDLTAFVRWLTITHTARWTRKHRCVGDGAVYQARFKSIAVENGRHLYWVWRYVERNALRANLVASAEDWRWGSLWHRSHQSYDQITSGGPIPLPENWIDLVNLPQTEAELSAFRGHIRLSQPFGQETWLADGPAPSRGRPHLRKTKK